MKIIFLDIDGVDRFELQEDMRLWQEAQKLVKNYIVIYKEKYQCQI